MRLRVSKKRIRNRTAAKAARPAAMLPARTWPRMPLPSGVGSLELAGAQEAAHDADPVGAEEPEERERGGDVQRDHEREIERLALRLRPDDLVPAEPRRDQHRMPETRDREELGDALDEPDHDGLEVAEHGRRR